MHSDILALTLRQNRNIIPIGAISLVIYIESINLCKKLISFIFRPIFLTDQINFLKGSYNCDNRRQELVQINQNDIFSTEVHIFCD